MVHTITAMSVMLVPGRRLSFCVLFRKVLKENMSVKCDVGFNVDNACKLAAILCDRHERQVLLEHTHLSRPGG
jgi:hypothetical protein